MLRMMNSRSLHFAAERRDLLSSQPLFNADWNHHSPFVIPSVQSHDILYKT
jgi:hypothetical protein